MNGLFVIPGTLLPVSADSEIKLGDGVYRHVDGTIRASLAGHLLVEGSAISVSIAQSHQHGKSVVPDVDQVVIGRVGRLTSRFAMVDILVLESGSNAFVSSAPIYFQDPFKGTLRATDIWPETVRNAPLLMSQAVRPGDLVRARIIGMGDFSAGFLITIAADDSLGVIHAVSQTSGKAMVPAAWNQMRCPLTDVVEWRKPAKPVA